ncbi:hypothetical protein RJT34_30587 [Clitoria ternatea]|uniref:Ammonium transporter AmtB-like domain-containing protein n=1 Tax=Clitoria ternatea TaxID=43366 RepID=A0AAN9I0J0_CLITE
MLGGAGFLWMGWSGFNGGTPFQVGEIASLAIINTDLCTATSLLVWVSLDMIFYHKSSVIGAVQGMITGLVCITPGAGLVDSWAAILMGAMSGSIPWYTMMVLHRRSAFFQSVDDTLGVFHTHAVAGLLGGILSGVFSKPNLLNKMYPTMHYRPGLVYSFYDRKLVEGFKQIWMQEEDLEIGDDAVHGEEAYALWGDGERMRLPLRLHISPTIPSLCRRKILIPVLRKQME